MVLNLQQIKEEEPEKLVYALMAIKLQSIFLNMVCLQGGDLLADRAVREAICKFPNK